MNSNRAKVRCRLSGAGYKRQSKDREVQNKIGAVKIAMFSSPSSTSTPTFWSKKRDS